MSLAPGRGEGRAGGRASLRPFANRCPRPGPAPHPLPLTQPLKMFDPVPLAHSLDSIYSSASLGAQGVRWNKLAEDFKELYGVPAQKVARAPGRVNVLGEHIDYCGFSVLPAAIERDVLMAFATTSPTTRISSTPPAPTGMTKVILHSSQGGKYPPTEFVVDLLSRGVDLEMPAKHSWANYFIAGAKGTLAAMNNFSSARPAPDLQPPSTLLVLVTGSVPEGSGLSSSSAVTTASAILMLEAGARREGKGALDRTELTQVAIESERLVGVNSGGMDQTASMFSQVGSLLHVNFVPELQSRPIKLPSTRPPLSFVIANTLVHSPKQLTAKYNYNCRVVECRLAARILARHLKIEVPPIDDDEPLSLKTVLDGYFHPSIPSDGPPSHPENIGTPAPAVPSSNLPPDSATHAHELKVALGFAATALGGPGAEDGLTWAEVAQKLDEKEDDIKAGLVGKTDVEPRGGKLKIWTRARHVLSEALRVYQFIELLEDAASAAANDTAANDSSEEILRQLGELMDASMASCQKDFECSCPELDELVLLARKSGSLGSRLTGAGWGGATVHLVPEPEVEKFIKTLKEEYYAKHLPDLTPEELDDVVFATKPEAGAGLFAFE